MNDNSMNTMKLKQINRNNIYNQIFKDQKTCKLMLTNELNIGLTTVIQNLKALEYDGLIQRNGFFESTGGRKADAVEVIADAKISIGVCVQKNIVYIVGCNLYAEPIYKKTINLLFENTESYYVNLCNNINLFVKENVIDSNKILGVSFAVQGIVSSDNTRVIYGKILDNLGMDISSCSHNLPYKCRLEHDSKAAGALEIWRNPDVVDGVVLLLNHNMGGAIITGSNLLQGNNMRSGVIEHMTIQTNGEICYCGKLGCAETICSANSLENAAKMSVSEFFAKVEIQDKECTALWQKYLQNLAVVISNVSVVVDGSYIISGYLSPYFTEQDITFLLQEINRDSSFPINSDQIIISSMDNGEILGRYVPAIGTALHYIKEFLATV